MPTGLKRMYLAQNHFARINNIAMSLYDMTSSPRQSQALHVGSLNIANAMA